MIQESKRSFTKII